MRLKNEKYQMGTLSPILPNDGIIRVSRALSKKRQNEITILKTISCTKSKTVIRDKNGKIEANIKNGQMKDQNQNEKHFQIRAQNQIFF